MATATWELVYLLQDVEVRRVFADILPRVLRELKTKFTNMRLDYLEEGDQISVMARRGESSRP